jgi:hypothetical protein
MGEPVYNRNARHGFLSLVGMALLNSILAGKENLTSLANSVTSENTGYA